MLGIEDLTTFPLLTDCTHTWLRTLDLLKDSLCLPVERQNLFTLNLYGYNNVVPSLRARPTLLTGNRVSQYLSHLIVPGARCLKYPLKLPHSKPWPLPSDFSDGYCVQLKFSCIVATSRNNAGSDPQTRTRFILLGVWDSLYLCKEPFLFVA